MFSRLPWRWIALFKYALVQKPFSINISHCCQLQGSQLVTWESIVCIFEQFVFYWVDVALLKSENKLSVRQWCDSSNRKQGEVCSLLDAVGCCFFGCSVDRLDYIYVKTPLPSFNSRSRLVDLRRWTLPLLWLALRTSLVLPLHAYFLECYCKPTVISVESLPLSIFLSLSLSLSVCLSLCIETSNLTQHC